MKTRIIAVAGGIAVLLVMVAVRIVHLTLTDSPGLARMARQQQREQVQISAHRGAILDRHGETLASSVDRPSIFLRPRRVTDRARVQSALATLGLRPQQIAAKLGSDAPFVWLKRAASPRQRDLVEALKLEGVGDLTEARRFYPHESAAAHVIGIAGVDLQGLEGVERYYERDLRGEPRTLEVERDARGREILTDGVEAPQEMQGASVQVTLDLGIQDVAERALERGVRESRARAGTAIVLDPSTGELLALANAPSFDPNHRATASFSRRRNRAVTDFYEPGSTFKPLLAAAAIEHGVVRPAEMVFCENGHYSVGKWIIHDHGSHGWLSVAEVLQVSSNIGAAKIGERLGRERFFDFLTALEIGRPTGIDLPGEVGGMLRPLSDWSHIALITTSFGQGVAVTPLQMARAFAAIANGGLLMKPYVGMRAVAPDGEVVWEHRPTVVRRVMRPETAATVTTMLERVLDEGGTGMRARVAGFRVAGKTGTAQKIEAGTGRYSAHARIASFVGFLPAEAPRVVILALLDEPETSSYGGIVAAPVFAEIATAAMERLGVSASPPPPEIQEASVAVPAPEPPPSAPAGMPSFIGLSMRSALERARDLGWAVRVVGSGYVASQTPPPGASAAPGKALTLNLAPTSGVL
ncbi:MAG: transpeptidase family protein [Deltaproteobacteria bacterium]|nr:transpeptidase family protein [Deltaproteobacteria bacterium]